jgi:hypothetical protein
MGSRPLLSGSLENYQKNAKLIEKYIVEHLPPHEDDGLVTGPSLNFNFHTLADGYHI